MEFIKVWPVFISISKIMAQISICYITAHFRSYIKRTHSQNVDAISGNCTKSSRHAFYNDEFVCQEEVAAFLEEQNSVDAEEVFLRKEKKEFMYMVLRRFRKEQPMNYEILIQVKYLEISVETVAEEYGLTKSGVNNRIYKAKRWLQEEFRKVYE